MFDRDFPFYFCIAGRMIWLVEAYINSDETHVMLYFSPLLSAKSVYSDVHFEKFCTMCTEIFEQLEYEVVATTLTNFISRYVCTYLYMCMKLYATPLIEHLVPRPFLSYASLKS